MLDAVERPAEGHDSDDGGDERDGEEQNEHDGTDGRVPTRLKSPPAG